MHHLNNIPPRPPGPNPTPSQAAVHHPELTPFAQSLPFDPIDHRTPRRRSLPSATASDPTTPLWTPACRLGRTRLSPRPPPIAGVNPLSEKSAATCATNSATTSDRQTRRRAIDECDGERSMSDRRAQHSAQLYALPGLRPLPGVNALRAKSAMTSAATNVTTTRVTTSNRRAR